MHWLDSVRERWQAIWPPAPLPDAAPPSEPVSLELLADRLLGDERIRGALTDDEFQPLLDWALDALDQVSAGGEAGSAEAATDSIREILSIVNDTFAGGAATDTTQLRRGLSKIRDAIGPPLVPPQLVDESCERVLAAIGSLEERETPPGGPEITETIAQALRSLGGREAEAQA